MSTPSSVSVHWLCPRGGSCTITQYYYQMNKSLPFLSVFGDSKMDISTRVLNFLIIYCVLGLILSGNARMDPNENASPPLPFRSAEGTRQHIRVYYGGQQVRGDAAHLSFSVIIWTGLSWLLLFPVPSCP